MNRLPLEFQVAQFEDKWRPFQLTKAILEVGAMGLAGSFVVNSAPKDYHLLVGTTSCLVTMSLVFFGNLSYAKKYKKQFYYCKIASAALFSNAFYVCKPLLKFTSYLKVVFFVSCACIFALGIMERFVKSQLLTFISIGMWVTTIGIASSIFLISHALRSVQSLHESKHSRNFVIFAIVASVAFVLTNKLRDKCIVEPQVFDSNKIYLFTFLKSTFGFFGCYFGMRACLNSSKIEVGYKIAATAVVAAIAYSYFFYSKIDPLLERYTLPRILTSGRGVLEGFREYRLSQVTKGCVPPVA